MTTPAQDVPAIEGDCRPVPDRPGYAVTSDGQVWSRHVCNRNPAGVWRRLKLRRLGWRRSYRAVRLARPGRRVEQRYAHEIVLTTFVGPKPDGMECRHLNGIHDDNRLENLAWGTHRENVADRARHGTDLRGNFHPSSKLTEAAVAYIRRLDLAGGPRVPNPALARRFRVSDEAVREARLGLTWKHVLPRPVAS